MTHYSISIHYFPTKLNLSCQLTKRLVSPCGRVHLGDGQVAGGHDVLAQGRGQVNLHEPVVVFSTRSFTCFDFLFMDTSSGFVKF